MLSVLSSSKPTRDRLTILSTCLLLAGSVGLAWLWVRGSALGEALSTRLAPAGWPVVLHLPEGWVELAPRGNPSPRVVRFGEAAGEDDTPSLYLIRSVRGRYVPANEMAAGFVLNAVRDLTGALPAGQIGYQEAPFGPFPGVTFVVAPREGHGPMAYVCAGAGVPGEAVYVLVLESPGGRLRRDVAFMHRVAENLEITAPALRDTADWVGAGLRFEPPVGTRFLEPDRPGAARVRCVAPAASAHAWQINVTRTWLTQGATAETRLADWLAEYDWEAQNLGQLARLEDRDAYRVELGRDLKRALVTYVVWCVPLGGDAAALVLGRAPADDADAVADACRRIAETLRAVDGPASVDVSAAQERSRQVVREIAAKGLEHWWSREEVHDWFAVASDSETDGYFHAVRKPVQADDQTAFEIAEVFVQKPVHTQPRRQRNLVTIASDLQSDSASGSLLFGVPGSDRSTLRYDYDDRRARGETIRRRARQLKGLRVDDTVETDDTFLADAVLWLGQSLVARSPEAGPALFSYSGLFNREGTLSSMYCVPLGRVAVPDAEPPAEAWGLLSRDAADGRHRIAYFADDGRLLREEYDHGLVLRRSSVEALKRHFPLLPAAEKLEIRPVDAP